MSAYFRTFLTSQFCYFVSGRHHVHKGEGMQLPWLALRVVEFWKRHMDFLHERIELVAQYCTESQFEPGLTSSELNPTNTLAGKFGKITIKQLVCLFLLCLTCQ